MEFEELKELVIDAVNEIKAQDVHVVDVRNLTSVTDVLIIASGTSTRHVKSIADNVVKCAKEHHVMPLGVEGEQTAEWILVDLGDIVVHIMLPETRSFYNLEKLWSVDEHTYSQKTSAKSIS